MKILYSLFICLEVLALFNLLIIVHELGHFLAARWRGLRVEGFGIWFGKPLWKKKINGVTYSLGSIPAGGFVKLPQMAPMESLEGETEIPLEELTPISALDKIIVAFAGPLFSFLLAVVFAVIVWGIGRPVSESEATRTIGYVLPDSPAAKAGLQAGDKILEVDGQRVSRFSGMSNDSITWRIVRSEGETIPIKVERAGKELTFNPVPTIPKKNFWNRKGFRQIQILPKETPVVSNVLPNSQGAETGLKPHDVIFAVNGQEIYSTMGISEYALNHPQEPLVLDVKRKASPDKKGEEQILHLPFKPNGGVIAKVSPDSPAEAAGLKPDDRIVAVDGNPVRFPEEISAYVQKHANQTLSLKVERAGKEQEFRVTPEKPIDEDLPRIGIIWGDSDGIAFDSDALGKYDVIHPRPLEQIRASVMSMVNTIGGVTAPKSNLSIQHLGGPVMMMRIYYMMFESTEGWRMALWFSVLLNVNLALMNLFPIPVLDGGHIVFAIVEAIRRRPVSYKVLEFVNTAAAMLVIGFMLFVTFFDVQDLFSSKNPSIKFKPKAALEQKK